jgi:hypothetical protein
MRIKKWKPEEELHYEETIIKMAAGRQTAWEI